MIDERGRIQLIRLPKKGQTMFIYDDETNDLKMIGTLRNGGIDHFPNGDRMLWIELT